MEESYFAFHSFGIALIAITAVMLILIVGACIWFGCRARKPSEHSRVIGVYATPGEIVSPLTTGPHVQYSQQFPQPAVSPSYATSVQGEELVLVPRSLLQYHNVQMVPGQLYPPMQPVQPQPVHNINYGNRQRTSMDAIRESSGAFLPQSPQLQQYPPQNEHLEQQRQQHEMGASRVLESYRTSRLGVGEADATELSEVTIDQRAGSDANRRP